MIRLAAGDVVFGHTDALSFAAVVLLVYMVANVVNFGMVSTFLWAFSGVPVTEYIRSVYVNILPFEFATALLTAGVAFSYGRIGVGAVGLLAVVLFVFQYLIRAGVQAYERGEELRKRTTELASLQVGLL